MSEQWEGLNFCFISNIFQNILTKTTKHLLWPSRLDRSQSKVNSDAVYIWIFIESYRKVLGFFHSNRKTSLRSVRKALSRFWRLIIWLSKWAFVTSWLTDSHRRKLNWVLTLPIDSIILFYFQERTVKIPAF